MEKSRRSAESGMGPLYDSWTRTSHLTVPAAAAQEAKEMKLANPPSCLKLYTAVFTPYHLSDRVTMLLPYFSLWYVKDSLFECAGTCFASGVEPLNATALSDECDTKSSCAQYPSRPYLSSVRSVWNQIMAVTGMVWICCNGFYYWVLYLWWRMDLCFNVLETFHFIWQISSVLQALIKGSFFFFFNNLNDVVIRLSYSCTIICPSPLHSLWAIPLLQLRWYTMESFWFYTFQVNNGNLACCRNEV